MSAPENPVLWTRSARGGGRTTRIYCKRVLPLGSVHRVFDYAQRCEIDVRIVERIGRGKFYVFENVTPVAAPEG